MCPMLGDTEALEFLCGLNGTGNAKSCANWKGFLFSTLRCVMVRFQRWFVFF